MTDAAEVWARTAELRRELADLVETLDESRLRTPSLCGAWDVGTVAAHLTVLATTSRLRFARTALACRGSIDATVDRLSRGAARGRTGAEIAATLRRIADVRSTPPLLGPHAPLADLVVHSGDIHVPLGLRFHPAPDDAALALEFMARSPFGFMPHNRLSGIRIVATDLDRAWRDGAEVRGAAGDLLLAIFGRPGFIDRVDGPGRDLLARRT